jgi:hypothetical protein
MEKLKRIFCRLFHRSITRPVNSEYTCLTCLRKFPAWPADALLASQAEAERWAKAAANGWSMEESAEMEGRQ